MSPQNVEILLYRLERYTRHMPTGDIVFWDCPDGVTYELDPKQAVPGQWVRVDDASGLPVMAFLLGDPNSPYWWLRDGRLAVSLHPLKFPLPATLLHDGDDQAYKQYFSTEEGNDPEVSGPLSEARRPAFVLQTEGIEGCPIHEAQRFRVMIVRSTGGIQHP
jgi:hypothetical protein